MDQSSQEEEQEEEKPLLGRTDRGPTNMRDVRILLCSHDAVDDKVGPAVEHEPEVLEGCEGEHPAGDRHREGREEDDAHLG